MNKSMKKAMRDKWLLLFFTFIFIGLFFTNRTEVVKADTLPYLIKVNRQQNCITIYKQDKNGKYTVPIKAFVCSTGGSNTPLGTYKTPAKYRWKLLMGDCWGQYSTRIVGGILFHSVWYYEQDASTLSARQYNKLGTAASHGCIRVTVADAKWIYDNCPLGTTVIIYDSKDPGPLGKPKSIEIPLTTGWDPTDPSNLNPWKNKKPTIQGAKNQTIKNGSKVDLLKGVTAKSSVGLYITKSIQVTGTVNTKKPGKYKITYTIVDALGRKDKKTVTFTVLADTASPILAGVKDQTVNGEQIIDRTFALKGVTASLSGKPIAKKNIKVTINKKNDTVYTIHYSVTGSNNKTTKKTATITIDRDAPVITGVKDNYITSDQVVNKTFALKGVSATDQGKKLEKSSIKVSIVNKKDHYTVTYQITDKAGNTAIETAIFTINDGGLIVGVKDQTITSDVKVDEAFALNGVTAYIGTMEVSNTIGVKISKLIDNKYIITYEITDENDVTTTEQATITVIPNVIISGVEDKKISSKDVMNQELALIGVTATEGDKDITDKIEVTISSLVNGKYTVTYRVADSKNFTKEVTAIFTVVH